MLIHPLSAADHVSLRRGDLERDAARRRAGHGSAERRRTPSRRTVADILDVLAEAVAAAEVDPRISSLLLDVLVGATRRAVPTAPVAAPDPTDPMPVHQRAIARLAAATARRRVVLDVEEWQHVARLLPLLTGTGGARISTAPADEPGSVSPRRTRRWRRPGRGRGR